MRHALALKVVEVAEGEVEANKLTSRLFVKHCEEFAPSYYCVQQRRHI